MIDEALTEEEKVEQLGKPLYDLMKCYDGATRAVPIINGVKIDPSLPKDGELSEKKDPEKKPNQKLVSKIESIIKWKIIFLFLKD